MNPILTKSGAGGGWVGWTNEKNASFESIILEVVAGFGRWDGWLDDLVGEGRRSGMMNWCWWCENGMRWTRFWSTAICGRVYMYLTDGCCVCLYYFIHKRVLLTVMCVQKELH